MLLISPACQRYQKCKIGWVLRHFVQYTKLIGNKCRLSCKIKLNAFFFLHLFSFYYRLAISFRAYKSKCVSILNNSYIINDFRKQDNRPRQRKSCSSYNKRMLPMTSQGRLTLEFKINFVRLWVNTKQNMLITSSNASNKTASMESLMKITIIQAGSVSSNVGTSLFVGNLEKNYISRGL